MYKIIYKKHGESKKECFGNHTDLELALEEMDKLEKGPLAEKGIFHLERIPEQKKVKSCRNCTADCKGTGKDGNANQCTFYTTEKRGNGMKRNIKILEITCCGECPKYNPDKDQCTAGAETDGENFFKDCPLEEK
jgi:hypothetical protein